MKKHPCSALVLCVAQFFAIAQEPAKSYLSLPTQASEQAYASIDGEHLKEYVVELAAISRRYRDNGHPQFWGRITGTEADAENGQWLLEKFRGIGLSDVHEQALDLPPQWMPTSWSVTASVAGRTVTLDSAHPTSMAPGTPPSGLDLEVVDAVLATEGDLVGRDLRGKAVFFNSAGWPAGISDRGTIKRITERGAAAIFSIPAIPGNLRHAFYPVGSTVPTFALGLQDAGAIRDLIGQARGGQAPRVQIHFDVRTVPNLKTATVWGSLPGTTDETIYVVAHRDGYFEGATDNASGAATMLGLAEYFAKVPREHRRRTIHFLGTSGHHDNVGMTSHWLADHKEMFARTALIINCEHTSAELLVDKAGVVRRTNASVPLRWHVNGSPRLQQLAVRAFDTFGAATFADPDPTAGGDMGSYYQLAPSLQLIEANLYWHTDQDVADFVPPSGLTATTRAYAKIIAEVNQLDRKDVATPQAR